MNEKFFALPREKQTAIINAGFRVFARNSYQKSPMQEVADAAGISKSLLFHYFRNKREFYLFLWERAAEITTQYLEEYGCYEPEDLFEMMELGMRAKLEMMRRYPAMALFAIKAFYEENLDVHSSILESYRRHFNRKARDAISRLDPGDFIPGLDLSMMYREMYLVSEGYLWEVLRRDGKFDPAALEKDFAQMLAFWKQVYLRKEENQS